MKQDLNVGVRSFLCHENDSVDPLEEVGAADTGLTSFVEEYLTPILSEVSLETWAAVEKEELVGIIEVALGKRRCPLEYHDRDAAMNSNDSNIAKVDCDCS